MSGSFLAFPFAGLCDGFWIVGDMRYLSIVQILYNRSEGRENLQGPEVDSRCRCRG